MRAMSKLLAIALTATMQSAMAGAVFLNFEDVKTTEALSSQYGSKGVTASGAVYTATSEACGGYGPQKDQTGDISFIRSGSCGALLLAQDWTKPAVNGPKSFTLTMADGFVDMLSFVYAGSIGLPNLQVHVFDAAGRELGLGASGLQSSACTTFVFCNWSPTVTLSFQGVARSVTFTAVDQTILIDDLRFNTPAVGPNPTPEPASIALVLGALGGLAWTRKRATR